MNFPQKKMRLTGNCHGPPTERLVISLKPLGDISSFRKWKLYSFKCSLFDVSLNSFQNTIAYIWIKSGKSQNCFCRPCWEQIAHLCRRVFLRRMSSRIAAGSTVSCWVGAYQALSHFLLDVILFWNYPVKQVLRPLMDEAPEAFYKE